MEAIIEWIRNLVVFILFATIVDMLIPSSALGKYVRFVIGLLLLILLINPLFAFLKIPLGETLSQQFFSKLDETNIQNHLEAKKKTEIQAKHHAYILEQMAVQLKKQVNPELKEQFQVEMTTGTIDADVSDTNELLAINHLQVRVQDIKGEDATYISPVAEIQIGQFEAEMTQNESDTAKKLAAIQAYFAEKLAIDLEKIEIIKEGEKS